MPPASGSGATRAADSRAYDAAPRAPGAADDHDAHGNDDNDDKDDELDAAFDVVFGDKPAAAGTPTIAGAAYDDDAAARELFATIAANYTRPVKNFVVELRRGPTSKEWIEICQPVMTTIIEGAEALELEGVVQRMVEFREALLLAHTCEGRNLDEESRDLLLSCYEGLVEVMPETFVLGEEDEKRESIIVHSLLRQIPEVGHVTFEKLYASGVTTLDALFLANAKDLEVATGVPDWLCQRICDKVFEHRQQLEGTTPETARLDHRARLVELLKELRRLHAAFENVAEVDANRPELAARKRDCLRTRQACALQINVLLAEMGEIELVEQLKTLGVERRIHQLDVYLRATNEGGTPEAQAATAGSVG